MDNPTFFLTRAARLVLEASAKERENKLLNTIRFADLPKVGNTETQGGIEMGSLTKLVEQKDEEKTAAPVETEEIQLTLAGKVKLASAHLYNYVNVVKEAGGEIKTASFENYEIDRELLQKTANLIVIDHYDLYKEAGIKPEWLTKLIGNIRGSGVVQKTIHPMQKAVETRAGQGIDFASKGYLRQLLDSGAGQKIREIAGKKGVQLGGAAVGGAGATLGLGQLLQPTE